MAERLGVSAKAVSRWEKGEGYPDISVLSALAQHLHVTVDELLADEVQSESKSETQFRPHTAFSVQDIGHIF